PNFQAPNQRLAQDTLPPVSSTVVSLSRLPRLEAPFWILRFGVFLELGTWSFAAVHGTTLLSLLFFHDEVLNPKGIPSQNPGLEHSDYPGWTFVAVTTRTGLRQPRHARGHEDAILSGLEMSTTLTQGSSFLATLGF